MHLYQLDRESRKACEEAIVEYILKHYTREPFYQMYQLRLLCHCKIQLSPIIELLLTYFWLCIVDIKITDLFFFGVNETIVVFRSNAN